VSEEQELMLTRCICALAAGVIVVAGARDGRSEPAPMATVVAQATAAEIEFWRSVADSSEAAELEAYLKAYPRGQFAPLAKLRLRKLKGADSKITTAPNNSPSAQADRSIPEMPPHKNVGAVGVQWTNVTQKNVRELGLSAASGVVLVKVFANGPADKAGLKPGDVVLTINNVAIVDMAHAVRQVTSLMPGQKIDFTVMRNRRRQIFSFVLGDLFKRAWNGAHQGDAQSMANLAYLYSGGSKIMTASKAKSDYWLRKAANAGLAGAMEVLSRRYYYGQGVPVNYATAFEWAHKAAVRDSNKAQFLLGLMYSNGQGTPKNPVEAARWYQKSAEGGLPASMLNLGILYSQGKGVEKSRKRAADWIEKAANTGLARAIAVLGWINKAGHGRPKNDQEALRLFRLAADNGDGVGVLRLAEMYRDGIGVAKDRDEAIRLFRRALGSGEQRALGALKSMKAAPFDPKQVQKLLSELGFDPGPVDGRIGDKTRRAIQQFQKERGVEANGEASVYLMGLLRGAIGQKKAAMTASQNAAPVNAPPAGRAAGAKLLGLENLESLDKR
jgi:TPR repeat protein